MSPKTILFYRQRIRAVDKILGPKHISEVTVGNLRLVLSKTRPSSTGHCYKTLNRLFRFLINDEIICKNPMAKIQPPKVEQKIRGGSVASNENVIVARSPTVARNAIRVAVALEDELAIGAARNVQLADVHGTVSARVT